MTSDPPWDLPLILGDAVHNLRSALDLAFVEMVTTIGKQPTDWTTFRLYKDREKLVTILGKGILEGEPDLIDMLADVLRAYEGGDPLLCALNGLDIADKHQLLIPVFSVVRLEHVDADIKMGGSSITMRDCTLEVSAGGVLNLIGAPTAGEVSIQSKGKPSFGVFFSQGTGLEGQPIIPTLTQLSELVSGILQIFGRTLMTRNSTKTT
jgi:hypothetical protein